MSAAQDDFAVPPRRGQQVGFAPFVGGALYAYDLRAGAAFRWRCVVVYGPERPAVFPLTRRAAKRALERIEAVGEPGDLARIAHEGAELLVTGTPEPFVVSVTCRGSLCGGPFRAEVYRATLLNALRALV
jgi:hypothetical protein